MLFLLNLWQITSIGVGKFIVFQVQRAIFLILFKHWALSIEWDVFFRTSVRNALTFDQYKLMSQLHFITWYFSVHLHRFTYQLPSASPTLFEFKSWFWSRLDHQANEYCKNKNDFNAKKHNSKRFVQIDSCDVVLFICNQKFHYPLHSEWNPEYLFKKSI